MILKNIYLSEFEWKKKFLEGRRFFAMENSFGEGGSDSVDENVDENIENEKETELKEKGFDSVFDDLDLKINGKEYKNFSSLNDYLKTEISEKGNSAKALLAILLKDNISGDSSVDFSDDETKKIIESVNNSDNNGSFNVLGDALRKAMKEDNSLSLDEKLKSVKNIFLDNIKGMKENINKIKEKIDEKEKNIDDEIKKINGITADRLREDKDKIFGKIRENFSLINKKIGYLEGDEYLNWMKTLVTKDKFKSKVKRIQDTKDGDENGTSIYEAKNIAFDEISGGSLDYILKDIKNMDIDEGAINALENEISEDLEIQNLNRTVEDCKNLAESIPFFPENFIDNLFNSDNVDLSEFDQIFNKEGFNDEDQEKIDKLKKGIINLPENANVEISKDPVIIGRLYESLEKLRDTIFRDYLSKHPELSDLKWETEEDREKFFEKMKIIEDEEKIKIEKFDDDKLEQNNDIDSLGKMVQDVFDGANSSIKKIVENKNYVDESGDFKIEDFENEKTQEIAYLNNNCLDKIEKAKNTELEIKEEKDPIKKSFLEKRLQQEINSIKDAYNILKTEKNKLDFKLNSIDNTKEKEEIENNQTGPQVVTLASIVLMIKSIYEEYTGNIKTDRDMAANKAAGGMAQSLGKGLGFDDAIMAGRTLSRKADDNYKEWFESNVKKYEGYDKGKLNSILKMMADTGKFNKTDLYGVLENLSRKGGFDSDNTYFLKALAIADPSFLPTFEGINNGNLDERIQKFVGLSQIEKDSALSKVIGKESMFRNKEKYGEWSSQSDKKYEESKGTALDSFNKYGRSYFDNMRNTYLRNAQESGALNKDGTYIIGKHVDFDDSEVKQGEYQEFLNTAIKMKMLTPKEAILYLIDGVATGIIPPRFATNAINKDIAGIFGWLDEFKKGMKDFNDFVKIRNSILLEGDGDNAKILKFNNETLTESARHVENKKIMDNIGIWIKGKSDKFFDETNSEIGPNETKWWSEQRMGKLQYKEFEQHILGNKVGYGEGTKESENLSAFINGTTFELNYFGKCKNKKGEIVDKKVDDIDDNEYIRLKETFKTFGAYYASQILQNYDDKSIAGNTIDVTQLGEKPAKYAGSNTKNTSVLEQGKIYIELLREMGGGTIVDKIKDNTTDKDGKHENVNKYFGRGDGAYKKEIDNLFRGRKEDVIKVIKEYQNDKNRFISIT